MIKVRSLARIWNHNLCTCLCLVCVWLGFTCGRFGVLRIFSGHISLKHVSRNNFKALCGCVVGIIIGMDSLGGALNPDIYVPLDGHLTRSRKVNMTLDEVAVRVERILQLKKTRSGFKSVLTKKRNEPSELLHTEKIVDAVKMKIMEFDQAFVNFKGAHDVYTKTLVEETSIMELSEYFESELRAVKELKKELGLGSQSFYLHLHHQLK